MHMQGSCSEFLGVILGVEILRMDDFSTVEHLCTCVCDGYGSNGIIHPLIVCMGVGENFELHTG